MKISAIILAAGDGTRMGTGKNKQLIKILDESVIHRSVAAFDKCDIIDDITVVCKEDEIDSFKDELYGDFVKLNSLICGGATRFDSVSLGFKSLSADTDIVVIHDGARCLVTAEIIGAVVKASIAHGAATASTPMTDTLKMIDGDGFITNTLDRKSVKTVQTPQAFDYKLYSQALSNVTREHSEITDDNMLLEIIGKTIFAVDTGKENIKITTAEDLDYVEFILRKRENVWKNIE